MIIARTPFRVSFLGGGSDLREFYSPNGYGAVVSAAIKKYMYVMIHPYFQDKIRIKYSKTEDVENVDDIQHPIVRECLRRVQINRGIEIASFADVPAGTGLGSSSSFTVGLLNALYAYKGQLVSKEQLAREACEIEIDILKEPIGKQDQYAAAYGNINYIRFNRDETVDTTPIFMTEDTRKQLESKMALYYVGGKRKASDILTQQKTNMAIDAKYDNMKKMVGLADEMRHVLEADGQVQTIGSLLQKGWLYKKELANGITNNDIDALYDTFMKHKAEGGKLLGAGGTGFLLIVADNHPELQKIIPNKMLPFEIDRDGSKILYYD